MGESGWARASGLCEGERAGAPGFERRRRRRSSVERSIDRSSRAFGRWLFGFTFGSAKGCSERFYVLLFFGSGSSSVFSPRLAGGAGRQRPGPEAPLRRPPSTRRRGCAFVCLFSLSLSLWCLVHGPDDTLTRAELSPSLLLSSPFPPPPPAPPPTQSQRPDPTAQL